jgi:hypothetical protein
MAKRILVPTASYHDWQRLLAQPDQHWKAGYSAMTLARSWEAAGSRGFPPEVEAALDMVDAPELKGLELLLAIPEFQVPLPGGERASQTDVLALAHGPEGLVAIAVEGKVDEPFGPTVGEKYAEQSAGVNERVRFILQRLGLPSALPIAIRYQLLHRTVSALLIAEQFYACAAVMLVHSFSPSHKWFADFVAFATLFAVRPVVGELSAIGTFSGTRLYIGWCQGDQQFRSSG